MKRSITISCLLISLGALFAASVVCLNMFYNGNVGQAQKSLKNLTYSLSFATDDNRESLAKAISSKIGGSVRVTYFSSSGLVLGDSGGYAAGSRLSFPEVTDALNTGYGESSSGGLTQCSAACAIRLSDGTVLRLCRVTDCLTPALPPVLFSFSLGVFLVLILLPVSWSIALGHIFTVCQAQLDCLRAAAKGRKRPLTTDEDELKPLVHSINETIEEFSSRLKNSESRLAGIRNLLDSMSEGLVVLDSELRILIINESAADSFRAPASIAGQNLLRLTHHEPIIRAVNGAKSSGTRSSVDFIAPQDSNKILRAVVSGIKPRANSPLNGGIILLISDVTLMRKTEQIRSDFVANASHELKTPLTTIKGFAELIHSQTVTEPGQIRHYLGLIKEESDRLILLISDILRLSELEAQVLDSGYDAVSLRVIAEKAVQLLRAQAAEKEVTLDVGGDAGILRANPDRLMQLFVNLIENSIKYNKPGGSVKVTIAESSREVTLSVADTGIGIPAQDRERVFERFYRVDRSHNRKIPGTGLGLAIVKHIAELYNGRISLESEPGKGTVITIKMPKTDETAAKGKL